MTDQVTNAFAHSWWPSIILPPDLWQLPLLEIRCKHLSSVNYSSKKIHHHYYRHQSDAASFCENYAKLCDKKHLEKRLVRGWWNSWCLFWNKAPFSASIKNCPISVWLTDQSSSSNLFPEKTTAKWLWYPISL